MSEPLYVPVLPVRRHARMAHERLRPDIQAVVAPLWDLPPSPGVAPAELAKAHWQRELRRVRGAHRRRRGWIDAPFAEAAQIPARAVILAEYSARSCLLRPVTGPERREAQQTAAVETARRCGCGVGVRVRTAGGVGRSHRRCRRWTAGPGRPGGGRRPAAGPGHRPARSPGMRERRRCLPWTLS
ncbi:beta family protein [Streptomyces europaeiscabiei]|uniref:beta family protein n=1 Tax=Streptomyces europaeiscabiei TaxID=146819 RepID=UPI0029A74994|nr:hypothetical protein [Streptomyces europaeiscabiei]MDX3619685.1 hypothetical protein [Streptomyces europaeiscabiei]